MDGVTLSVVRRKCAVSQTNDLIEIVSAIKSASALTEVTFLHAGQALESSIDILATLTSRFEAVRADLEGEHFDQAIVAFSCMAAQVGELGQSQARESARLDRLRSLTEAIDGRIARMTASLKDVEVLAVNAKIATANILAPGLDFTTFASEIGRTLDITRRALDRFAAELRVVRQHVGSAHASQLVFETRQHDAARSISDRLAATMTSVALQRQRAARASVQVKLGSARVRQRVCDAILASQIGDITRQRLEHADTVLSLVAGMRRQRDGTTEAGHPPLDDGEQFAFTVATHRLQSAQLADAATIFDREVRRIAGSLESMAKEARALRRLGDLAYGSMDRGGGTFIADLESQASEAFALFEDFETARAEIASVTASVSAAATSLRLHLQTVQALEADIRIMGLNTTFKCARAGREGLALSIVAQNLRTYANGFAKEADALMAEIEAVTEISASLIGGGPREAGGTLAMRQSLAALRIVGQSLDVAMADLDQHSEGVAVLLLGVVAKLVNQPEIGGAMRGAANNLAALLPSEYVSFSNLAPRVADMVAVIEHGYTMAVERAVHDRVTGRAAPAAPGVAASPELEDFLF